MKQKKHFVAYFYFIRLCDISLGLHVCLSNPDLEVHLPFGFIRVGWIVHPQKRFGFIKAPLPLWGPWKEDY